MSRVEEIREALRDYAIEVDATAHVYGHILLVSNAVLCFAEAQVPSSEPLMRKLLCALQSLPIYGDEDIHWEIVRAYTLARLRCDCLFS